MKIKKDKQVTREITVSFKPFIFNDGSLGLKGTLIIDGQTYVKETAPGQSNVAFFNETMEMLKKGIAVMDLRGRAAEGGTQ